MYRLDFLYIRRYLFALHFLFDGFGHVSIEALITVLNCQFVSDLKSATDFWLLVLVLMFFKSSSMDNNKIKKESLLKHYILSLLCFHLVGWKNNNK